MRPHGDYIRYKHGPDEYGTPGRGCRCGLCRGAVAVYERNRYRMMAYGRWQSQYVDAAGTKRRIGALMRNGWPLARLAAQLGSSRNALRLKLTRHTMVTAATAEAVRVLYDRLWDQPAPAGTPDEQRAATRARNYARQHGFVPPLAWDDGQIDNPDAVPVEGWERGGRDRGLLVAEALDLLGFGLDEREAAERLGVARGTLSAALSRARAREVADAA